MRMILHRVTDDVRDLRVASVVLLVQRVHDAALHGLESVLQRGNRARADDIRRILAEVEVKKIPHRTDARQARLGGRRWRGRRIGLSRFGGTFTVLLPGRRGRRPRGLRGKQAQEIILNVYVNDFDTFEED